MIGQTMVTLAETEWANLLGFLFNCTTPLVLIAIGFSVGTITERRHLKRLAIREQAAADVRVSNLDRSLDSSPGTVEGELVIGEAVIANDYFKAFIAGLIKLIGGELRIYRSLMERGRREATLRMVEHAKAMGYDEIRNVRIVSADVGGSAGGTGKNPMVLCAVITTGTAVRSSG